MGDAGLFDDRRVELMDGEIIEMSPQKSPHAGVTGRMTEMFIKRVPEGLVVRCHLPLDLGMRTEPEPDISISKGSWSDFVKHHPKSAELVVEISNASAKYDRENKGSLYAKANIPEFWLVNLPQNCVEVYREPVKDRNQPFGFTYSKCLIVKSGDSISPLCLPKIKIAVKQILP